MSIFKCKMCGGSLEISADQTTAACEYCGTEQTLPKLSDDRRVNLYDRANHFRRNNEFDKAMSIYENILSEDGTDAEAYWSLVLCRYGIEYVEDPATHKRIPTVNRAQFTSVFDDDNYKSALSYADGYQKSIYEAEAKAINEIQKGILAISQKEEPFDVFICYKETDNNGRRTPDSVLANDLYHQLTAEGFKVFFSRISLEDKLGVAYEPYIFAALNSAKVMVALGTRPEYFKAVWVKNEWRRYLALVKQSGGKKVLIPAYKDMDPYDLPEEFSHLQAQDMGKLGFMQDLIRGIKKLTQTEEPKAGKESVAVTASSDSNIAPLLKRAFMYLQDGDWKSANTYCERVLDQDPECAEAYIGKLMAELYCHQKESLFVQQKPFMDSANYKKAYQFASDDQKEELQEMVSAVPYSIAQRNMDNAATEEDFRNAAELFGKILNYRDSAYKQKACLEKAEVTHKDSVYHSAADLQKKDTIENLQEAVKLYTTILGWRDADDQLSICKARIVELKQEKQRKTKKLQKILIATAAILCVVAAAAIILTTVIIPNGKYNDALALMDDGRYEEAVEIFTALDGYKDSNTQAMDGRYKAAVALMEAGKYEEAIAAFEKLDEYKDSAAQIANIEAAIIDGKYKAAVALKDEGKYTEAIESFTELAGYKDSAEQIQNCEAGILDDRYNDAVVLINEGSIVEAYEALITLGGYKDSAEKADSIYDNYLVEVLGSAKIGDSLFFGAYEQDTNTSNGKEYIEWLVLAVKDGKALVISKYGLDCRPYNAGGSSTSTSSDTTTWEYCSLRKWLNDDFMNIAFSDMEKAKIPTASTTLSTVLVGTVNTDNLNVRAEPNSTADILKRLPIHTSVEIREERIVDGVKWGHISEGWVNMNYIFFGGSTYSSSSVQDKVFLLSTTEAEQYFGSDEARQCTATAYAKARGVATDGSNDNCWWWLRSSGSSQNYAAYVYYAGVVREGGFDVDYSDGAVRPAMWIEIG